MELARKVTIGGEIEVEIPPQIGQYEFIEIIGIGSFSTVFLVKPKSKDLRFACKAVSRELLIKNHMFERFEREVRLLQTFSHPNIVKLYDILYDDNLIYLILEDCPNGELFALISESGKLPEEECKTMFTHIVEGLVYIHSKEVAHRDLKPENILLDANMNPKIADFGLSHQVTTKALLSTPCGSPFYAPPEVISSKPYDGKQCDLWSLGVVLFTMSVGALPWTQQHQTALYKQIIEGEYKIPKSITGNLRDLIHKLMSVNPADRPTALEVLSHPWITTSDTFFADNYDLIPAQFKEKKNELPKPCTIEKKPNVKKPLIIRPNAAQTLSHNFSAHASIQHLIRKVPITGRRDSKDLLQKVSDNQ